MRTGLAARIILAYLAVIAGVVFAALRSQRSLDEAETAAQRLSERSVQGLQLAAELETLMHDRSYVSNYLLGHDPSELAEAAPHRAQFEAWIEQMDGFSRSPQERAVVAGIRALYLRYTAEGDEVVRLAQEGHDAEARQAFFGMKRDVAALLLNGQKLFAMAEDDMRARRAATHEAIEREQRRIFWLTALGAAFSLAAGFLLSRYITRPLNKLVLRLAEGGEAQLQFQGDEIGLLESQVNALLGRVRRQERALQQAEKLSELGEIAAEIAHETLNPLAGARGMLQVLKRGAVPRERLGEELNAVEVELRRVEEIVRRLMRYARPLEPHARTVPLSEVVDGALKTAAAHPSASGRELRAHGASAVQVVLDPTLIEQVLVNLLVNACEASPAGSVVELRVSADSGSVQFEVRDHGPGIAAEQRERLFKPFFTTKPNGNGLGLAVSRNIVLEHGGRIEADAAPDGGSIFKVTLPRAEAL